MILVSVDSCLNRSMIISEEAIYSVLPVRYNKANYYPLLKKVETYHMKKTSYYPSLNNMYDNHKKDFIFFRPHLVLCRLKLTKLSGILECLTHCQKFSKQQMKCNHVSQWIPQVTKRKGCIIYLMN